MLFSLFKQFSVFHVDRFDRLILEALQRDGRISNKQLAQQVHLSESACLRRVRALEEDGMIERYVAMVSQSKAGIPGDVLVHIGLHREEQSELAAFEEAVRNIPEVMECYLMTGEFDYLLRVVVADMADFERIHKDELTRLPGVARVNSSVAIRTVLKRTALPLR
ncbi:MAG: winged helix-turn-helix transcriptional regulator [Woeseiaceae bacterium]|nr:winged helix-turn-helix transcriptional regulator [Woeseiaceae bacterium]